MASERKPGAWLPMVYYYLATAIGLAILLFGLVGGLRGLVTAALPQLSSEARYATYQPAAPDGSPAKLTEQESAQARKNTLEQARIGGFSDALSGAVGVVVGLPVFVWHLRQARRREPELHGPAQPSTSPESTD